MGRAARVCLAGGSALLTLLGVELALRLLHPIPYAPEMNMVFEADPDTGYRIKPDSVGYHANGVRTAASHQGFRNREVGKKRDGVFRVLALGDSFTVGSSVEQDQAYPQVLEQVLNRTRRRSVEVVNAGVGGWDPFQYAQFFARRGRELEPDLVLVGFFVGNDAYSAALSADQLLTAVGGRRVSRQAAARPLIRLEIALQEHSHLARALRATPALEEARTSCKDFSEAFLSIQRERLSNHLKRARERDELARANVQQILRIRDLAGVPVVVALLPDETQVNAALRERLLADRDASAYDFAMPQALLRVLFQDAHVPVIDLLPAFLADARCLYNNTTHWTSEGHALAAETLARELGAALPGPR